MRPLRVFVIQPFKKDYSASLYRVIKEVCSETDGDFEALRADVPAQIPEPQLQDRIDAYIKGSDICVADLRSP